MSLSSTGLTWSVWPINVLRWKQTIFKGNISRISFTARAPRSCGYTTRLGIREKGEWCGKTESYCWGWKMKMKLPPLPPLGWGLKHSLQDVNVVNDFSEPPRSDTVCLDFLCNILHVHSLVFWDVIRFLGLILIPVLTFSIYVDLRSFTCSWYCF